MNLMETRNEKLKSELVSLVGYYDNPNFNVLQIPEKMDEEEFLSRLHAEEEALQYHLDGLENEFDYYDLLYKDGKIT